MPVVALIGQVFDPQAEISDYWTCSLDFDAELEDEDGEHEIPSALLSDIQHLPERIIQDIQQRAPFFKLKDSADAQSPMYANSCVHCGATTDDYWLHEEYGGPFFMIEESCDQDREIEGLNKHGPFRTHANYDWDAGETLMLAREEPLDDM